jgi:DNA-binding protein H-NS
MRKKLNLDSMTVDEMWKLHEDLSRVLSVRLTSEKRELEKRLAQLRRDQHFPALDQPSGSSAKGIARAPRRKYPRVFPKYRNPQQPSETWSGRGKQPRWLSAALKSGHKIEEFVIANMPGAARSRKA